MEGTVGGPGPAPQPHCALQGQACRLQGKADAQDFTRLLRALQVLGLSPEESTTVWALLATVLQLGNICFSSSEVGFPYGLASGDARSAMVRLCTIRAEPVLPSPCIEETTQLWATPESRQIPIVLMRR